MDFLEIAKMRFSSKKFTGEELPKDKVDTLLEMIKLSATAFGLQPFKVVIVKDQETKDKLLPASFNQQQIPSASHVLVFCAYTDVKQRIERYKEMMLEKGVPEENANGYINVMNGFMERMDDSATLNWAQKQTYLAMGNAINGAKALGFDSSPMEGFSPKDYSTILELDDNLVPTVVVPIGIAADEFKEKIRYSYSELFIEK